MPPRRNIPPKRVHAASRVGRRLGVPVETVRPGHDQIAVRAYELWQADGSPNGRDEQHWLDAERELLIRMRTTAAVR